MASLRDFFVTGVALTGPQRLLLMLPLCLSVALVYKTMRYKHLREVPLATLGLWITIVLGMYAVGLSLWGLFAIMV